MNRFNHAGGYMDPPLRMEIKILCVCEYLDGKMRVDIWIRPYEVGQNIIICNM